MTKAKSKKTKEQEAALAETRAKQEREQAKLARALSKAKWYRMAADLHRCEHAGTTYFAVATEASALTQPDIVRRAVLHLKAAAFMGVRYAPSLHAPMSARLRFPRFMTPEGVPPGELPVCGPISVATVTALEDYLRTKMHNPTFSFQIRLR